MSLVSSMDMTMAFGFHSAISGEMGIPALRDDKSSTVEFKGMQVSISFVQMKGESTGTTDRAARPRPVVFAKENGGSRTFGDSRSRTKDEKNAVKAQIKGLMGN